MSKLDEKKTFIDVLKGLFYICTTAMLGLSSFIFVNFEKTSNLKLTILMILLVVLAILNLKFAMYLFDKIKELREL